MEIAIGIVLLIIVAGIMFKYAALENMLFGSGEDYVPIGNTTMKICIGTGALVAVVAFIYQIINNESPYTHGVDSIWGIICNVLPYFAFAAISYCVYRVCVTESSVGRMIARSLFVVFSGVICLAGAAIGSIMVIVILTVLAILYIMLKVWLGGGASSSSSSSSSNQEEEETYKITDENGWERTLKPHGFNTYKDDKGDYWKDNGNGTVSRDN